MKLKLIAALCVFATLTVKHASAAPVADMASCIARAKQIVARMTLDEKIASSRCRQPHRCRCPASGHSHLQCDNGPAGAANGGTGHQGPATALPAPIALAATFDTSEAYLYGTVCGKEALAYSNNMIEAPSVISRECRRAAVSSRDTARIRISRE